MYKNVKPFKKGLRIINKNNSFLLKQLFANEMALHMPVFKRGKGPFLYDHDENRFVDFYLSNGAMLLGHADPKVTKIVKSWIGRGYGTGYYSSSYELLASRVRNLARIDKDDALLFYNSSTDASNGLFSLLLFSGCKTPGLFLSDADGSKTAQAGFFGHEHVSLGEFEKLSLSGYGFIVVRPGRVLSGKKLGAAVERVLDKEILLILDETSFEAHIHSRAHGDVFRNASARILGSWVTAGLSFGCVCVKRKLLERSKCEPDSELFCSGGLFFGLPPLFLLKAAIQCIGVLEKNGGIDGLKNKTAQFFEKLDKRYFELIDDLVYVRTEGSSADSYDQLHAALLQSGLFLSPSSRAIIALSYSHTLELLAQSARTMNSLFSRFYR